ncbi:MAG TPA: phosphoglycerate kinase, partial [Oscillospiraceae bacterium]|nr:phosphoglycerate kinase [Oscillospiraceae bacterium]
MNVANKKTVKDVGFEGKKALVRCDFNVPLKDGVITSDTRIVAALPTIRYLMENGAAVILCSHLGRPKGQWLPEFSLAPVAKRLSELLGIDVRMSKDIVGEDAHAISDSIKPGEVALLENLRYEKAETDNDPAFAKELASLADIYVNDAFGTAHRAHASTAGVADYLPAVCGFLIQKEIEVLGRALNDPVRPFVAVLGGAKVSDKIGVIESLLEKVDTLIIGGAMAYTFQKAKGGTVGSSPCEDDKLDLAREILAKAEEKGVRLLLPVDNVVTEEYGADAASQTVPSMAIPDGWMGMDIGPETVGLFTEALKGAGTVVWNGPMGVFEFDAFAKG